MSEGTRINLRKKPYKGIWLRCAKVAMMEWAAEGQPKVVSTHSVRMGVKRKYPRYLRIFNQVMREIEQEYKELLEESEKHLTTKAS